LHARSCDQMEQERQRKIEDIRERAARANRIGQQLYEDWRAPYERIVTRQGIAVWRPRTSHTIETYHAAIAAAYPDGFWDTLGRRMELLDRGEPAAVEMAVLFLEADPWFFRSGYVKERLLRRLARLDHADAIKDRLRAILIAAVDGRDRREFRRCCRLARAVSDPSLHAALEQRGLAPNAGIRRRAEWMLAAMEHRPVSPALVAAHSAWWRADVVSATAQSALPARPQPRHLRVAHGMPCSVRRDPSRMRAWFEKQHALREQRKPAESGGSNSR
jgi:hypothetical protein